MASTYSAQVVAVIEPLIEYANDLFPEGKLLMEQSTETLRDICFSIYCILLCSRRSRTGLLTGITFLHTCLSELVW